MDTREPKGAETLIHTFGAPAQRMMLDVGDYTLLDHEDKLVIVTRKAGDLYQSLHDGHFQDEMDRCIEAIKSWGGGKLFWLLEGVWDNANVGSLSGGMGYFSRTGNDWFRKSKVHGDSARSLPAMQISAASAGVQLLWTGSFHETCMTLAVLYERATNGWPTKLTQGLSRPQLRFSRDGKVSHLMGLWPRLREQTAILILKEFDNSIGAVITAVLNNDERLTHIKGLGVKGIANLKEIL